jgi:uncharacterized protein (DUF736 family)
MHPFLKHLPFLFVIVPGIVLAKDDSPEYRLQDCVVKVQLNWKNTVRSEVVLNNASEQWKKAMVSQEYPSFGVHYAGSQDHYIIYFKKDCENRKNNAVKIMQKYMVRSVKNFPDYSITTGEFKVGSDGVIPSGWWIDH